MIKYICCAECGKPIKIGESCIEVEKVETGESVYIAHETCVELNILDKEIIARRAQMQ